MLVAQASSVPPTLSPDLGECCDPGAQPGDAAKPAFPSGFRGTRGKELRLRGGAGAEEGGRGTTGPPTALIPPRSSLLLERIVIGSSISF